MLQKTARMMYVILKKTIRSYGNARASQAAAGLAYYAIFSLFPLLLVLIALGSYILESERVFQQTLSLIRQAIPISNQLIEQNLRSILEARGTIGITGLIGLAWSASGVFSGLAYNINLAWPTTTERSFFQKRLVAFGMVAVLALVLVLSLFFQATAQVWTNIQTTLLQGLPFEQTESWGFISSLIALVLQFLLLLALYRWIPTTRVDWRAALWSALITAAAWRIATSAFTWYLDSGLGQFQIVYGSLGTLVALLLLIYLVSSITLFGAHLCATIQHLNRD